MTFTPFDSTDIVEGRTTKVSSGFWPDGSTNWSSSLFETNFWDLSTTQTPSTAYGTSLYDVRKTLYYMDVYPNSTYKSYNDPYFSIAYGNINGDASFDIETGSMLVNPTKAIYTQYKNLLLGTTDLDGMFSMTSGSTQVNASDIFVINYSSYKYKNKIDEGVFQISLSGNDPGNPNIVKIITLIDDSYITKTVSSVYQLISGSLDSKSSTPSYQGLGLLYPNDGIVVFNAAKLAEVLGVDNLFNITSLPTIVDSTGLPTNYAPSASYFSGSKSDALGVAGSQYVLGSNSPKYNSSLNADLGNQNNILALYWSLKNSNKPMVVRKTEFVPSKHYFVRVKNQAYNYSNNPTYVYSGNETLSNGTIPAKGTIRMDSNDPHTYPTSIGLYTDSGELVAVGKLSRPAVKSFSSELLLKIRIDM